MFGAVLILGTVVSGADTLLGGTPPAGGDLPGPSTPSTVPAAIRPLRDEVGYALYTLDFEPATDDRDLNRLPDPDRWERVRGGGYPFYSKCLLDENSPREGEGCLRMEPDGRSVAIRTLPLPVSRFFLYEVNGWVRTKGVERGAARTVVEWLARDGTPIGRSTSEDFKGTADWRRFSFTARPPQDLRLTWMRLRLEATAGETGGDYHAVVWFDSIHIRQRPRAALLTAKPANIFLTDEEKTITLLASGLLEKHLTAHLRVDDQGAGTSGAVVHRTEGILLADQPESVALVRFRLPLERPGLYRATATIDRPDGKGTLGRWELTFAIVPPPRNPPPVGRRVAPTVGIALASSPPTKLDELAARLGCRLLKVPLQPGRTLPTTVDLLVSAKRNGSEVVGLVLLDRKDQRTLAEVLDSRDTIPSGKLPLAFVRYADRVDAWQVDLEREPTSISLCEQPGAKRILHSLIQSLRKVLADRPISVPWNALYSPPRGCRDIVVLDVEIGPEVLPENIPRQLAHLERAGQNPSAAAKPFWATIRLMDRYRFPRSARLGDLVRRAVMARVAGAERVFLQPLVDERFGLLRRPDRPTMALLVWRTVGEMLDGLRYLGSLPLPGGSRNALFGDDHRATLVVWSPEGNRTERIGPAEHALQLVDLIGQRTPLPRRGTVVEVPVGPMPVFIEGLDPGFAATCSSLRIEQGLTGPQATEPSVPIGPSQLESEYRWQRRLLTFRNRFPERVRGWLLIEGPADWRVEPRFFPFTLSPGATYRQPLRILPPYNAICGTVTFKARWRIEASRLHQAETPLRIRMTSSSVPLRASAHWLNDGLLEVRVEITNRGSFPFVGRCQVTHVGTPLRQTDTFRLAAGGKMIRRWSLSVEKVPPGGVLKVSLREVGGRRFANLNLVPPPHPVGWARLEPGDEN